MLDQQRPLPIYLPLQLLSPRSQIVIRVAGWPCVAHFTLFTRVSKSRHRSSNVSNGSASPISKPSSSIPA